MARSDVYYNGKNLLVCQLDELTSLQRKGALKETAAKSFRELAAEFRKNARQQDKLARDWADAAPARVLEKQASRLEWKARGNDVAAFLYKGAGQIQKLLQR